VQKRWPKIKAELKRQIKKTGKGLNIAPELFAISAATGENVRLLLYQASQLLKETPEPVETEEMPVYRPKSDPREFTITRIDEGWRVSGQAIERAAEMTYWEHFESIRRFQRIMEALGIDTALRQKGIQNGETVFVGEYELEWQD